MTPLGDSTIPAFHDPSGKGKIVKCDLQLTRDRKTAADAARRSETRSSKTKYGPGIAGVARRWCVQSYFRARYIFIRRSVKVSMRIMFSTFLPFSLAALTLPFLRYISGKLVFMDIKNFK